MKKTILVIASITSLAYAGCGQKSSPDGRARLRDSELSQRIDKLEKRQIVILDSLRLLNEKTRTISTAKSK